MPKGGGAIRDIGEKFGVNAVTGTASFTIPLAVSAGRAGFGPPQALSYDSGAGNGPFGFGWHLGTPAITRKTDKGLPRYRDDEESDVFILSGAEDLVPILDATGKRVVSPRILHGVSYNVRRYTPRIESAFARIERWTETATGISHFRSITRDNITSLYGLDASSRISSPDDATAVFSFLLCRTYDARGNVAVYDYVPDDGIGVVRWAAHEANRSDGARATQRYLKAIRYGNVQPYFPDGSAEGTEPALPVDWRFQLVFDFGDHTAESPAVAPDQPWPIRPDPFSTYRAGFEVRTYRRIERVLMFHSFPEDTNVGADCLVRSTDLRYSDEDTPTDPRNPIYTFLTSATHTGYRRQAGGYFKRSLPPLEFDYTTPVIQPDVLSLDVDSLANLPEGIDGQRYRWLDLDGEGLSSVLAEATSTWLYKRNTSPLNDVATPTGTVVRARLDPAVPIAKLPSRTSLADQRMLDLSGDGQLDIVAFEPPVAGYYERSRHDGWLPFRPFDARPDVPWNEPNLRLLDLTGDGLTDALLTEDGVFTFWPSRGARGFGQAERVPTAWDEERGPAVVIADGSETVFLADMTGDGLSDVVRVRDGEVCYWPNQGYGRFGAKVVMDHAPRFGDETSFDTRRVRLADIDGSGTTDLLYIADDGVYVCFNQSGNAWAQPQRIAVFPGADALSSVEVMDLLGNGTACLVWSSPLPAYAGSPLRYVDLMGGQKPHLMTLSRNNLGAETRVSYAPSTRFYLADKVAGRPWVTRLPHVVHVVERVETVDFVGRSRFVSRYAYHHGYYDGYEREFRGFGQIEQWDTDEHREDTAFPELADTNWSSSSWSPPVLTRSWFHTGAFLEARSVSRQFAHEYWVEPTLRADARAVDRAAMQLPDSAITSPVLLTAFELQEAYRALKGLPLRVEIYADDGSVLAANPYTVTETNYTVEALQSIGPNKHGVFFPHARETVTFQYERQADDPRVTHSVTLQVDAFGNPLRAVSIGYPRRAGYTPPEPALSAAAQGMLAYDQTRLHITATEQQYTNAFADPVATPDVHRAPMIAEVVSAEWTGVAPSVKGTGITDLFSFAELETAWSAVVDVASESIPSADVDGSGTPATTPTRRVVSHTRTLYRKDDLGGLCAFAELESMALPGDTFKLALAPSHVASIFGSTVTDAMLSGGGYVHFPPPDLAASADGNWWAPAGRVFYSPGDADTATAELTEARAHFYQPRRAIDAFGGITHVSYAFDLLVASHVDAVGNTTTVVNDARVLHPSLMTDPNLNRAAVAFDVLGLVVGTAVMGKTTEALGDSLAGFVADLDDATMQAQLADPLANPAAILGSATTRLVYDLFAYARTRTNAQPSPPVAYTLARETHASDGPTTRYQYALSYSDGFGHEIQKKALAEPGPIVDGGPIVTPRWVGSGWTIFDNKGKPVRTYEPFFTATPAFEFAPITGVSTVVLYDSASRGVATIHPNATWGKVVFDAWQQASWDVNDTVLIADPRTDGDIGDRFTRYLAGASWTSWHDQRIGGALGSVEQVAAKNTEAHAATPQLTHADSLGRACLVVADNGSAGRYPSRTAYDPASKPIALFDARGRRVFEYALRSAGGGYVAGYDLAGNPLYSNGMDGGARRKLVDAAGLELRTWDALGRAFELHYDGARRPTHRYVTVGGTTILLERSLYGEGMTAPNLCGRLARHCDQAGLTSNDAFDYKGNLLASTRQLAAEYHKAVDWTPLAALTDPAALDAAAQPLLVTADRFSARTSYDALNRVVQAVTPHSATMKPNAIQPAYNEANLLERIDVWTQQASAPTGLLDPSTAPLHAVTNVDYNARGQRVAIWFGSGTTTAYTYDPLTFRLASLTTTRPSTFASDQRIVQALAYAYDPIGNISHIEDDADTQDVIFFRNRRVAPSAAYTYDAIYRLVTATGREHIGQQATDDDSTRVNIPLPGDGNAMATYIEQYQYDSVGNLLTLIHQVASGNWTRNYTYTEPSQITATETCNRLSTTSVPGDPAGGPYSATYGHDAHGNMTRMPHLPMMTWDEQDRLRSTTRQVAVSVTPETTYYTYDSAGQRQSKATDPQASTTWTKERIYLGAVELCREYASDGSLIVRETLHISDGAHRIAVVETRTQGSDKGLANVVRYQHGNHLGSATLELDDNAAIITYEEYFPYGATSYQSVRSQTETPKRYRYTGKERDDENALYYNQARYYASWLGCWVSADPIGPEDGPNLYLFNHANPITRTDPSGTASGVENLKGDLSKQSERLHGLKDQLIWANDKLKHAKADVLDAELGLENARANLLVGYAKPADVTWAQGELTKAHRAVSAASGEISHITAGIETASAKVAKLESKLMKIASSQNMKREIEFIKEGAESRVNGRFIEDAEKRSPRVRGGPTSGGGGSIGPLAGLFVMAIFATALLSSTSASANEVSTKHLEGKVGTDTPPSIRDTLQLQVDTSLQVANVALNTPGAGDTLTAGILATATIPAMNKIASLDAADINQIDNPSMVDISNQPMKFDVSTGQIFRINMNAYSRDQGALKPANVLPRKWEGVYSAGRETVFQNEQGNWIYFRQ